MNTHIAVRPARVKRIVSAIKAMFKTWRAEQREAAEIEALEALGPEMLDDIGVTIVKTGTPPKSIAHCNPYLIATAALSQPRSRDRRD